MKKMDSLTKGVFYDAERVLDTLEELQVYHLDWYKENKDKIKPEYQARFEKLYGSLAKAVNQAREPFQDVLKICEENERR